MIFQGREEHGLRVPSPRDGKVKRPSLNVLQGKGEERLSRAFIFAGTVHRMRSVRHTKAAEDLAFGRW